MLETKEAVLLDVGEHDIAFSQTTHFFHELLSRNHFKLYNV